MTKQKIRAAILLLAEKRQPLTFCPSEIARELQPDGWRSLMPLVREVAKELVAGRKLQCTQGGHPVSPSEAKGPIRLSRL